jgi:uncharacterized membrane protein YfcA
MEWIFIALTSLLAGLLDAVVGGGGLVIPKTVTTEKVVPVYAGVEILAFVMLTHLKLLRSDKKTVATRVNIGF